MSLSESPRSTQEQPFNVGKRGAVIRKLDLPHPHQDPLKFSFVVFDPITISLGIHSYSTYDYDRNLMTADDIFIRDIKPESLRDLKHLVEFQAIADFIKNMGRNLPALGIGVETAGNYVKQAEDIFAAQRAKAIHQLRDEATELERIGVDLTAQIMLGASSMDELLA